MVARRGAKELQRPLDVGNVGWRQLDRVWTTVPATERFKTEVSRGGSNEGIQVDAAECKPVRLRLNKILNNVGVFVATITEESHVRHIKPDADQRGLEGIVDGQRRGRWTESWESTAKGEVVEECPIAASAGQIRVR
jgi:hypothetical protein